MKLVILWTASALLGVAASAALCRSIFIRDSLGQICGRGHLLAIASRTGIYEADLADNAGGLETRIVAENLHSRSCEMTSSAQKTQRDWDLVRAQFSSEDLFRERLQRSGLSETVLRREIEGRLRGAAFLEQRLLLESSLSERELEDFYAAHRQDFTQPTRWRAAHIFLSAPDGAEPEVIKQKEQSIRAASDRLAHGADFAQLAAELSEDEATKTRGGDLNYFSETRMPSEFTEAVSKLQPGDTSPPFRSHLGFHLVRSLEVKPAGALSFAEARGEIAAELNHEKRRRKLEAVTKELSVASYIRGQQ